MSDAKKDMNELYQRLRQYRGSIRDVSLKAGCSREWVRHVLLGKYADPKVIRIATKVLADRFEDEAKVMAQVTSVVSTCDASKIRIAIAV